jgi:hypothetical protein
LNALRGPAILREGKSVAVVDASIARPRRQARGLLLAAAPSTVAPALAVLAAAALTWLAFGVGGRDVAVAIGYEALFVAAPGWLLLRALSPGRGPLEQLALGWALGYVLEILSFIATGALGVRSVFPAFPLLWAALALGLARFAPSPQREPSGGRIALGSRAAWGTAALCVLTCAYAGIAFFARTPLPWQLGRRVYRYGADTSFELAIAGEAKHHWPVDDASVSGVAFPYHIWVHLHMGAMSTITHLDLALILLRLVTVSLAILLVLGMIVAARRVGAPPWAAVVAAALPLFFADLDLAANDVAPFNGLIPLVLSISPTLLLGLALFPPAATVLAERLRAREPFSAVWREWLLLALFLLGCGGAKATILPVLAGGLVLLAAWEVIRTRAIDRAPLSALALVLGAFAVFYVLVYRHAGRLGLGFSPLASIRSMPAFIVLQPRLAPHFGGHLYWLAASVVGTLLLFAAVLVGAPWALARARLRADPAIAFLVGCFVVGLGPYFLLGQLGNSQLFFTDFGILAGCLVSGAGLAYVAHGLTSRPALVRAAAIAAGAWTLALAALAVRTFLAGTARPLYAAVGLLAVAGVAPLVLRLRRTSAPRTVELSLAGTSVAVAAGFVAGPWTQTAILQYAVLAAILVSLALGAAAAAGFRSWLAGLATLAVLAAGFLDAPLDWLPDTAVRLHHHRTFRISPFQTGLNAPLYQALTWIRSHTSPDDVLAVSNYYERRQGRRYPSFYTYAAFSERRTFLEGWLYTPRAYQLGGALVNAGLAQPFPVRYRLNQAVFGRGDRRALRVLARRYGVRYLVEDRVNGPARPAVRRLGPVVFSNGRVTVVKVTE